MSIKSKVLTEVLRDIAPCVLADDWDNVGFQVGDDDKDIHRVMTALEITEVVIDEAVEKGVDYIVTHHPLIFKPVKGLIQQHAKQRLIRKLIQHDINYYCMHTNFDYLHTGTSDLMAKRIGLCDIAPLLSDNRGDIDCALGKIGRLPEPLSAEAFGEKLCQIYQSDAVKYSAPQDKIIEKVALISGAGMSYIDEVASFDADAFVTGDVKYHEVMDSLHYGMAVYDVGHFESEVVFSLAMSNRLQQIVNDNQWQVDIMASDNETTPFRFALKR